MQKDYTPPAPDAVAHLHRLYYDQGHTYGAKGLHYKLAQLEKDKPAASKTSRGQVAEWLKLQEIQQRFARQKKGGDTGSFAFAMVRPWYFVAVDLIDYSGPARDNPIKDLTKDELAILEKDVGRATMRNMRVFYILNVIDLNYFF